MSKRPDKQITAMRRFYLALKDAPHHQQFAAITWLAQRFTADAKQREKEVSNA